MRVQHTFHPLAACALAMTMGQVGSGQVPYPDHVVQDVSWTNGVHHVAVTQKIVSPSTGAHPALIMSTAQAEFVSGTQVHLTDGFHAGWFTGGGGFRARIDEGLGAPGDVVAIAPDPATSMIDSIIHVPRWEKFEIGLQLPPEYRDAIDRFFHHYYSGPDTMVATPDSVDLVHDLNPYADDSLQLVMSLTDPTGQQRMKWGFYMREAMWASNAYAALLTANTASPLAPYTVRFRTAPDMEGPWSFALSIRAPHTVTLDGTPLPDLHYTGYTFICDPPLPDNKGPLSVSEGNHRNLRSENGEPFMALGVDLLAHHSSAGWWDPNAYRIVRHDIEQIGQAMSDLHDVGGNFSRTFLLDKSFAPEYVNPGVYDRYRAALDCNGGVPVVTGNCQYQCWAFDQVVDLARMNGIYLQLCVNPYPPIIDYETFSWGHDPYLKSFVAPRDPVTGLYDMKKYFYQDGDPANKEVGVFYYWKRRYKYIMARWGWSVNIPIIEPFNEIDQMLTYGHVDLTETTNAVCPDNRIDWLADPDLPGILNQWITDITSYVRDTTDLADPVTSPLGEPGKLFLLSYAGGPGYAAPDAANYYRPFTNPKLDLIDIHKGINPGLNERGHADWRMEETFDQAQGFWNRFPSSNASVSERKPFNHGEFHHGTSMSFGGWNDEIETVFHNYDVSFHNEIWTSAFSGKFAAGTTWKRERVFWWAEGLKTPPPDANNPFPANPFQPFSSVLGDTNVLNIEGNPVLISNHSLHHHFKPLADLLAHPSWTAYGFFSRDYTVNKVFSAGDDIESYYLKDTTNTIAIGWVHNRNAWVMNGYYLASDSLYQNFLGCDPPDTDTISLTGFLPNTEYHITWFPTHMDSTVHPLDTMWTSSSAGMLTLDLSTAPLGGTLNAFLDTLHADYAFIVTPAPFHRSLTLPLSDGTAEPGWDFALYPNPARDELFLRLPDDMPKDIVIHDLSGRQILSRSNVTGLVVGLPIGQLAKGAYYVRVSDGTNNKTKKLIIH